MVFIFLAYFTLYNGFQSFNIMATHSSILAWRTPMDRGACRATVHTVAQSQAGLSGSAQHRVLSFKP